jgi:glyoxylase-like metal-dependent hydrolase (beta-lactamase superfamily II)
MTRPISPIIEAVSLSMPAVLGSVNVYLIRDKDSVSLVDTGLKDRSSQQELEKALTDRGLRFSDIESVFLTHHHADHAGLAHFLQQQGAKIYMSAIDASLLVNFYRPPENDVERAMLSFDFGLTEEFLNSVLSAFSFIRKLGEEFEPDIIVGDGDTISLGNTAFEVIACPGHTPGHLCLVSRELQVAFTGDCVISPKTTHISASPSQQEQDPYFDYILSLERLLPFVDVIPLSGHGAHLKPLNISALKIKMHLEAELSSLRERLTEIPASPFTLSQTVNDMRPRVFPKWLAVSQTAAYLNHLVRQGNALCEETREGRLYRRAASHIRESQ